jgi:LuxR family transcriptional regulator, maltose regulon positive regulatory protein
MPRKEHHSTPIIISRFLYTDTAAAPLDTSASFAWLELHSTFYFDSPLGSFTARCEQRADASFWYAFRRYHKRLYKAYLGRSSSLTTKRLLSVAQLLADKAGA